MTRPPVVPRSLSEPVPASQARSKLQDLIDADRAEVERAVIRRGDRELAQLLARSEADLRQRLAGLRQAGHGASWTAQDAEASLAQVRAVLALVAPEMVRLLARGGVTATGLGQASVIHVLRYFEAGAVPTRPLAVRAALALEHPRLLRYEASVARYGTHTIGAIGRQLQLGVLTGQTFDTMAKRLAGSERTPGLIVEGQGWARRIVRTEAMAAYAEGAQAEMRAQDQARPGLKRRLVETFDRRTAPDSYAAHGEVRGLDESFVDGAGRVYLLPPGRPNDRAVLIPYRDEWEGPEAAAPRPAPAPVPLPQTPTLALPNPPPVVAPPAALVAPLPPPAAPLAPAAPPPPMTGAARLFVRAEADGSQAKMRSAIRSILERQGLPSVDVAEGRSGARSLTTKPEGGSVRAMHYWDGAIEVRQDVYRHAVEGMRAAAQGLALAREQIEGIRTFVHEEIHGTSRIKPVAYQRHGVGIEEALTELTARRVLARALRLDPDRVPTNHPLASPLPYPDSDSYYHGRTGSYDRYIERLSTHVANATIPAGLAPAEALARRTAIPSKIEEAVKAMRAPGVSTEATLATPDQHTAAFGRALGLSGAHLDGFVAAVREDRYMRK